jgi:hypothetical protein
MANRLKKNKLLLIPLLLSIILMVLIFFFSSQNGLASYNLSIRFARRFARIIFFNFDFMSGELQNQIIYGLHGFVRKAAHFTIYALLGFNVFLTAYFIIKRLRYQILAALSVSAICAVIDEVHQLSVPGRGGAVGDVIIDVTGAVCGILAALIILSVVNYIRNEKFNMEA